VAGVADQCLLEKGRERGAPSRTPLHALQLLPTAHEPPGSDSRVKRPGSPTTVGPSGKSSAHRGARGPSARDRARRGYGFKLTRYLERTLHDCEAGAAAGCSASSGSGGRHGRRRTGRAPQRSPPCREARSCSRFSSTVEIHQLSAPTLCLSHQAGSQRHPLLFLQMIASPLPARPLAPRSDVRQNSPGS
jgi:hypothetical protein